MIHCRKGTSRIPDSRWSHFAETPTHTHAINTALLIPLTPTVSCASSIVVIFDVSHSRTHRDAPFDAYSIILTTITLTPCKDRSVLYYSSETFLCIQMYWYSLPSYTSSLSMQWTSDIHLVHSVVARLS